MEPYESLGMVSYSSSIATMTISLAVCETFSVKEWHNLEKWVRDCTKSLKIATFDRPYTTFYWSANISIVLSCTVCELFGIELHRDLEI